MAFHGPNLFEMTAVNPKWLGIARPLLMCCWGFTDDGCGPTTARVTIFSDRVETTINGFPSENETVFLNPGDRVLVAERLDTVLHLLVVRNIWPHKQTFTSMSAGDNNLLLFDFDLPNHYLIERMMVDGEVGILVIVTPEMVFLHGGSAIYAVPLTQLSLIQPAGYSLAHALHFYCMEHPEYEYEMKSRSRDEDQSCPSSKRVRMT